MPILSWNFVWCINGLASNFFRSSCGLQQGFPLAPLLFIIMMHGLSRLVTKATSSGLFKGFRFDGNTFVSHLFFVDDLLFFTDASRRDVLILKYSLIICRSAISMICNNLKYSMSYMNLDPREENWHSANFDYTIVNVTAGLKYLGYLINPNDYSSKD